MLIEPTECQLVLIDYQSKLMPVIHDGAAALGNARRLAQVARWVDVPVWGTEQNPDKLGPNDLELKALCKSTFSKMHFSSEDADLIDALRPPAKPASGNARSLPKHLQKPAVAQVERNTLVLAGCEAHVCLLQSALVLLEEEFDVWVVTDACSSRTERNRDAAFDRLASAGAELVTTEMVLFEWMRSCEHPHFKDMLALVK